MQQNRFLVFLPISKQGDKEKYYAPTISIINPRLEFSAKICYKYAVDLAIKQKVTQSLTC